VSTALAGSLTGLVSIVLVAATAGPAPVAWHTYRGDRISIRYPPRWTATARPLTAVTSPGQAIAIGSYRFPTGSAGADGCEPREALDGIPPGGVFIFGWDYGQLPQTVLRKSFPPEPRRFRLTGLADYECMGHSYALRFRAAGRAFQIHVYLGPRADAATRATVLRILDTFRAS
jgi:hypothetical protein